MTMKIIFEQSFSKDLKKIRDKKILNQIDSLIQEVKVASKIAEIKNIRKLKGYESFYRINLGNYRIGIDLSDEALIFVRVLHRRDIYRYFP